VKARHQDEEKADFLCWYEELTAGQPVNALADSQPKLRGRGLSGDEAGLNATRAEVGDVGAFTEG
jgi:hypothetical protein